MCRVALMIELRIRQTDQFAQPGVELRLDCADREMAAVGALVDPIEVRAAVEQVRLAAFVPAAHRRQAKNWVISDAAPSHIAASITCPRPESRAS